jgi:hypothetical protein
MRPNHRPARDKQERPCRDRASGRRDAVTGGPAIHQKCIVSAITNRPWGLHDDNLDEDPRHHEYHCVLCPASTIVPSPNASQPPERAADLRFRGADDGTRTGDPHLGKAAAAVHVVTLVAIACGFVHLVVR